MNKMKYAETIELKSIDEEKQIIEMVCSKEAVDRDNEIVVTDGIDLKNIKKNGPLFFAHDQRSLPIGKILRVWKDQKELKAKAQFVSKEANPLAPLVYQSIKEGSLSAVSIGFLPDWPSIERKQLKDGSYVHIIHKSELLEISIVGVPASTHTSITVKSFKEAAEEMWERGSFDGIQLNLMNDAIDKANEPIEMDYEAEIIQLKAAMDKLKKGSYLHRIFDEVDSKEKLYQEMIDELKQ